MLLDGLNDKQKKAILATEGPVLIIAGAGSGKTRALTHRIAYLIEEKKVAAYNILAVTFTNKAASEMKERIIKLLTVPQDTSKLAPTLQEPLPEFLRSPSEETPPPPEQAFPHPTEDQASQSAEPSLDLFSQSMDLFGEVTPNASVQNSVPPLSESIPLPEPPPPNRNLSRPQKSHIPTVGTFHSICAQLLRKHIHLLGFENQFTIYDANDQVVLMKQLMKARHMDPKKINPKAVLGHISQAKNQLMTSEQFAMQSHNYFTEKVSELYTPYQQQLAQAQSLDFDDLIMKTVQLFQENPELLSRYQDRYRYISVDEYQDTNHAQYVLIHMLAKKHQNLCVIGDPDQSIYSWRGANMQNILDFEKDYPEALVIKLEQNYRSTPTILEAAHSIIAKNRNRKEKQLWTDRTDTEPIRVWTASNERDEGLKIAQAITAYVERQEQTDYRDFAILYRTNAQSRALEEACMRYGLPYKIVGGVKFYLRKEIKDVIAYLRVIQNPDDTVSLLRIINTPSRKIGGKTIETIQRFSYSYDISLFRALERIQEIPELSSKHEVIFNFISMIRGLQRVNQEFSAGGVIKHVLSESGYKKFLLEDKSDEGETRYQNVQELTTVADKYEGLEPGISLATFLEEVSLISDLDTLENQDNAVTLMTLHSAKGLEFPVVFISGMEEGVFPHSRSLYEPQELEEERRLMYVGVTRAMNSLYLLYARQRMLFGEFKQNAPSQFLLELPDHTVEASADSVIGRRKAAKAAKARAESPDYNNVFAQEFGETDAASSSSSESAGSKRSIPVEGARGFLQGKSKNQSSRSNSQATPGSYRFNGTPPSQASQNSSLHRPLLNPDELSDGDRVRHPKFGDGVVVQISGGIVTIAFKSPRFGIKKLALSIAPLEKI
jgi:DNA helicase-2/ATP-dependent DNA helicase PcrA